MSEIEPDPSVKWKVLFHVGAQILNLIVVVFRFDVLPCVINTQIS